MTLPDSRRVVLDIFIHFLLSLAISAIVFLKSGNLVYAVVFIGGGVLIDLDHFLDYYLFFKRRFNLRNFLKCAYLESGKVYIFLHSWEIIFLLLLICLACKSRELLIFSISLAFHLAIDTLQRKNILCYFLIYRIIRKFEVKDIFPEFS